MTYLAMLFYVVSLCLFCSSMCNPTRPGIEILGPMLAGAAVLFGVLLHRKLYRKRR